jgi:hypothetical protein
MAYKNIRSVWTLVVVSLWILLGLPMTALAQEEPSTQVSKTTGPVHGLSVEKGIDSKPYRVLWPGHYIRQGTVASVGGDIIKVNTGELLPRFLSAREAMDKGLPALKKGDQLQLVMNDQNLVIDYHLVGQKVWHRIVRGRLAQPSPVGHEWAVIHKEQGGEEAFAVRPMARSKVSAIPVNVPAVFLMDESNKVIDASFGNEDVLQQRTKDWKKSPPKAPYRRIEGTLLRTPGQVLINTQDGKEQSFEVRPYIQEKLGHVPQGSTVILLIDDENKVSDVAQPPAS